MSLREEALKLHTKHRGKIAVRGKVRVSDAHELALAYTPGVAEPCKEIAADPDQVYRYTSRGNMVAVVSNGTAILGLGDLGPEAALPVMEGKALLFKEFAGVDAFPVCIRPRDVEGVVETVKNLEPSFGGINLEDISAPSCFEIERRLKEECRIPVFHDDQHGTAVVCLAALLNAAKLAGKKLKDLRLVINGAGAAGTAVGKLMHKAGVGELIICDLGGALYPGRKGLSPEQEKLAGISNRQGLRGSLADALRGSDVFIGVSAGGIVTSEMVNSMAAGAIVMAMANPEPEIYPEAALRGGARVVCTGRSDFPNQVNNVLAFPGIFRGALDVRADDINEEMKIAAAYAIAGLVQEEELRDDYIIPDPFDRRVAPAVAAAVAQAAVESGAARTPLDFHEVARRTREIICSIKNGEQY
jgi:malate dehydrogenase (oxaloacetate-decarboxylating)